MSLDMHQIMLGMFIGIIYLSTLKTIIFLFLSILLMERGT